MTASGGDGSPNRTIFISAAEPSADLHAAALIRAYRLLDPAARFVGIAGPKMRDAGCDGLYDMTAHAAMLGGVFRVVPKALAAIRESKRFVRLHDVDLAIVVDSPTLHLPLAKHIKRAGVPVLYFIAPQIWAWGQNRIAKLRRRADRLAVILPFEQDYFSQRGMIARYVGHPLFDELASRSLDREKIEQIQSRGQPRIAILPGSRGHVVEEVFAGQLEVATAIAQHFDGAHFFISVANDRVAPMIDQRLKGFAPAHSLHHGHNGEVLSACDLALIASGTITLEAAYYHIPMIVMYNASRVVYELIGRWIINCQHLSLVNILAGRAIVPEFMPYFRSTKPIIKEALRLLESEDELERVRTELNELMTPMVKTGASANAAQVAYDMVEKQEK